MTSPDRPLASVILVVGNQRERAGTALRSILDQDGIDDAEVIVFDAATKPSPPLAGSDHPRVRVIRKEQRPTYGEMRAEGVHLARGDVVAFLEEHCVARQGWLRGSIDACSGRWAAVGGEVYARNAGVGISDAVALMFYGRWRAPAEFQESDLLPGHNGAYRRAALQERGQDLKLMLMCEALLQWKMGKAGHALCVDPSIKFEHLNESTISAACQAVYSWNRCFGAYRPRIMGWPVWLTAFRVIATPLIPFVRVTKMFAQVLRERPRDLGMFARHFVAIFIAQSAAAAGMAMGHVFGPGNAPARLTELELDASRALSSA